MAAPGVLVGAINVDVVVSAALLPKPGETVAGSSPVEHPGGKDANAVSAIAAILAKSILAPHCSSSRSATRVCSARPEAALLRPVRSCPRGHARVLAVIATGGRSRVRR